MLLLGQTISSVGSCVPWVLVVLLTKECGDTDMACKRDVGVHLTEYDLLRGTLLLKEARKRYGYKSPSDLRSLW